MTVYTVMSPPPSGDAAQDADRIAFVKEGFCWPALFAAVLWLVWHRLWLGLLGYLAVVVALSLAGEWLGGASGAVLGLVFAVLFALEANGVRRWTLERNGWTLAAIVSGSGRDECETRFFHDWTAARARPFSRPLPFGTSHVEAGVLGLFPSPETSR